MWLVVLLLDGRLLERVLDVESGGVETAPVSALGSLHAAAVVGVHIRSHQGAVLEVGLDGESLGIELGLAARPASASAVNVYTYVNQK
jgi:hypothetical protein